MTSDEAIRHDFPSNSSDSSPPAPRCVRSEEILRGDVEVLIEHHGELYRLRRTRNGKLILQK